MEHEVFVPVPVASLRRTLGDAARVARCVPGLQQDAEASAGPQAGRLRFRADGHTITYRGTLTLEPAGEEDAFLVTGKGVEARGQGSAELALTIGLTETDGGTTISFSGTASGDGRIVDVDEAVAVAAARRLLDRFTQQLVTETLSVRDGGAEASSSTDPSSELSSDPSTEPSPESSTEESQAPEARAEGASSSESSSADGESVSDAPVPPSSPDPSAEMEFIVPDEPPAEAAHARRTMIGRSTEEVDHAPPRGRYAPVPSPEAGAVGIALRWAAPAAALAIASAVVVGRALRRRRP